MAAAAGEEMENVDEIQERLRAFNQSLTDVENIFKRVHQVPASVINEELSTLEKAKFDLIGAFAMTSLFWMYLNVSGVNVKEHPIKQELDRIKTYMGRAKEIQTTLESAPKLNTDASRRMIRNALWDKAQKSTYPPPTPQTLKRTEDDERDDAESQRSSKKRK